MSYFMEYAESVNPLDEVIEDKGVRILVDPKAVLFLLGTEMDYKCEIVGRNSCSTIRTRPRPAAAANRCRSSRRKTPITHRAPQAQYHAGRGFRTLSISEARSR